MRNLLITCLFGFILTSNAAAAISRIELNDFNLSFVEETPFASLELCGERLDSGKMSCGLIQGFSYSNDFNSMVKNYELVVLEGETIVTRDSAIVLGLIDDMTGRVELNLECRAQLSEYRYSLDEKIAAFVVTGNWPEDSDSHSLTCVVDIT